MIRRKSDVGCFLIAQSEHARIAADIAVNLGGAFAVPSDLGKLAGALRAHSSGFAALDARPPLSPAGRPANIDELPLVTILDAWARTSESALAAGPHLGMMLSLLCLQRAAAVSGGARTLRETFQINKLQHRQIEIQEQLRTQLGIRHDLPTRYGMPDGDTELTDAEAQFFYGYRLMLFCLQLALELCTARHTTCKLPSTPPAPRRDGIAVQLRTFPGRCCLSPFPLKLPLTLLISARHLAREVYDHELELYEALSAAPESRLPVSVEP